MNEKSRSFWRNASQVFEERAEEYDNWYEASLLFDIELAALKELKTELFAPRVELGVGPGRFAAELGVTVGVDPARAPLRIAAKRIDSVCQGVGENIPFSRDKVGTVFILFTLCFVDQPVTVLSQVAKVLRPGGHLVLGFIPGSGPWGKALLAKKEAEHPFYRYASFYEIKEIEEWLEEVGLEMIEGRSSLYQEPDNLEEFEPSRLGWTEGAGFVVMVARKG